MGLGNLLTRNLKYDVTNTVTGEMGSFELITDGMGAYPNWSFGEYRGGMGIPAAWRSALLLSDLLGQVPWHAFRSRAGQPPEQLDPTPPLLEVPAPGETRMTTFSSLGLDLLWHGNAISLVGARNSFGWPTATIPVPAEFVQVRRVQQADNDVMFPVGEVVYMIGGRWRSAVDVIHVKGPCRPGALRGMGVLENHFSSMSLSRDLAEQAASVGTHGVPTMKIKSLNPDLTVDEAEDLKAKVISTQRTRQPMVLNPSTDIEPIAWNPTETQLIEARKFSLHEWALIFGIPLSFLGAENSSRTYSNVEQEGINLLKWSLGGHLARFEQAYSAHMPRGTWAKANLDSILRSDTLTRYQAHEIGIRAGFLTDDEARRLEERQPLTPEQRAHMAAQRAPTAPAQSPAPRQPAPVRERAAERHTGGMIALIPANPHVLAVPGGDRPEDLHLTLAYLGDDVTGWPSEQRAAVLGTVAMLAQRTADVRAEVMGHAEFNPAGANDHEPCAVYLTSGADLVALKAAVGAFDVGGHPVFLPHVTAGYGVDPAVLRYTGPITFDRLRVALGDVVTDYRLGDADGSDVMP